MKLNSQRKPKFFLNVYLDVNKDKFEFIFNIMKINMQIRENYIKWGNKHSQKRYQMKKQTFKLWRGDSNPKPLSQIKF